MAHLINGVKWYLVCQKCAKYLAFGTYGTADTDALTQCVNYLFIYFFFLRKNTVILLMNSRIGLNYKNKVWIHTVNSLTCLAYLAML